MFDLVFSNINDLHIAFPDTGMVKPHVYHPPLSIEMPLFVKTCSKTSEVSYFKYTCVDYTLLYHILSYITGHICVQNLLLVLLFLHSIRLFMKPLIDLFPEALLKDLIFPRGFPALCGTIF
jgi:hypothetical protein